MVVLVGRTLTKSASCTSASEPSFDDSRTPSYVVTSGTTSGVAGAASAGTSSSQLTPGAGAAVRSASVSPRSARRRFFDQYPPPAVEAGAEAGPESSGSCGGRRGPGRPDPAHAPRSASVSRGEGGGAEPALRARISSAATSFFQSIKDKRKVSLRELYLFASS